MLELSEQAIQHMPNEVLKQLVSKLAFSVDFEYSDV